MLTANADYARVTDDDHTCVGLISRHRILSIDYPADPVTRRNEDDARPSPGG
jgi:osmoprotectant transport system ATP-binding protein